MTTLAILCPRDFKSENEVHKGQTREPSRGNEENQEQHAQNGRKREKKKTSQTLKKKRKTYKIQKSRPKSFGRY